MNTAPPHQPDHSMRISGGETVMLGEVTVSTQQRPFIRNAHGSPERGSAPVIVAGKPGSVDTVAEARTVVVASTGARRHFGIWAVGFAFLTVTAFSTAPSPLYGLYEQRDGLSSLTVTAVYAVYAAGIVLSLLLVGHVSDWYGRRRVLIPALAVALVAGILFCLWQSLPGLFVARILTGLAVGATVATATAYLTDIDIDPGGTGSSKAQTVATIANIGGFAIGPLIAGLLAQYLVDKLTVPYVVFVAALALAVPAVFLAPESRVPTASRPGYRPQRLRLPATHRSEFVAALTGIFLVFAVSGFFAALAGTFLAGTLHHPSDALAGVTLFVTFGAACLVQTTTTTWPLRHLLSFGVVVILGGLAIVVAAAWVSPPSLALFLVGGALVGGGGGAIFRGTLAMVISAATSTERASALATFFVAGYVGLSLPVVALGVALEEFSSKVTLLAFALVVGLAILCATPVLLGPRQHRAEGGATT